MNLYKLTDSNNRTRGGMQWGEGATHAAPGEGSDLCSGGVIHCYASPLIAVLMDPGHADYLQGGGKLWLAEGEIIVSDGLKAGCKSLTTLREIEVPAMTLEQRAALVILSVKQVCDDPEWMAWAGRWLSGKDRSAEAAAAAAAWAAAAHAADLAGQGIDFAALAEEAMRY